MFDRIKSTLQKNEIFRIVFVGDSLTSAEWVHPNWREIVEYALKETFTDVMSDWKASSWNIRTINSGMDGATTRDIRERLEHYVFQYNPQLVMLMIGGNDKYFLKRTETKDNLKSIIDSIASRNTAVTLSTDPALENKEHDQKDEDLREIVRSLKDEVDVFIDLHSEMKNLPLGQFYTFVCQTGNEDAGIKPGGKDFLHPNTKGNAYMAQVFLKSVFGIAFDPEKYLQEVSEGVMFPDF